MAQGGSTHSEPRISGQTIVSELARNMELGQLELAYSVLLPCVFSVYLHPEDYRRLQPVEGLIKEDARRALAERMAEWNARTPRIRRGTGKPYRIASADWWIELFPDSEDAVPQGDVEIHSELNDAPQPGYRGAKTTLMEREPAVTSIRPQGARRETGRAFAEFRYRDESGPQTYFMTQDEIAIGRGGEDRWVDLALYAGDEVSREHARVKRDAASGAFSIVDGSRNGTWLNGRRLRRGVAERLPDGAEIGITETLKLTFAARR